MSEATTEATQSAADNTRYEVKELMFTLVDLGDYTKEDLTDIIDEVFESLEPKT